MTPGILLKVKKWTAPPGQRAAGLATANSFFALYAAQAGREQPIRHWHNVCIMATQNDLIDLSGDFTMDRNAESSLQTVVKNILDEPMAAETKLRLQSLPFSIASNENQKIWNSPTRELKTFYPFHLMHHEKRRIDAYRVDWYFRRTCGSYTTTSLWHPDRRIFGEDQVERERKIVKWRFIFGDVNNDLNPKMIHKIEKSLRNSFVIKHSYAYELRNIETEKTLVYFQNKRSPWFETMSEERQWSEEQEKKPPPSQKHRATRNKMGSWGEPHGQGENYWEPTSSFPCWSRVNARLASKQTAFVGAWCVRQRAMNFQMHCGSLRGASCS